MPDMRLNIKASWSLSKNQVVRPIGAIKKSPNARKMDNMVMSRRDSKIRGDREMTYAMIKAKIKNTASFSVFNILYKNSCCSNLFLTTKPSPN